MLPLARTATGCLANGINVFIVFPQLTTSVPVTSPVLPPMGAPLPPMSAALPPMGAPLTPPATEGAPLPSPVGLYSPPATGGLSSPPTTAAVTLDAVSLLILEWENMAFVIYDVICSFTSFMPDYA